MASQVRDLVNYFMPIVKWWLLRIFIKHCVQCHASNAFILAERDSSVLPAYFIS